MILLPAPHEATQHRVLRIINVAGLIALLTGVTLAVLLDGPFSPGHVWTAALGVLLLTANFFLVARIGPHVSGFATWLVGLGIISGLFVVDVGPLADRLDSLVFFIALAGATPLIAPERSYRAPLYALFTGVFLVASLVAGGVLNELGGGATVQLAADLILAGGVAFTASLLSVRGHVAALAQLKSAGIAAQSHADLLEDRIRERALELERVVEQLRATNRDLQEAERRATAATRAKSLFIANISHEIRTPLNAIVAMAELLSQTRLDPQQRQYLETLLTGSKTLQDLVGEVLDFSKIEAREVELAREPVDLAACIESAVDLIRPAAVAKKLELTLSIREDVPSFLMGDEARLRQIFVNLLTNAVKFTPRGAVSLVASGRPIDPRPPPEVPVPAQLTTHSALYVAVADTGPGIPLDRQKEVFESFTRIELGGDRDPGGTGLGLAICREIVQLMEGALWVESRPGEGSTFYIYLPVTPLSAQEAVDAGLVPTSPYVDVGETAVTPKPDSTPSSGDLPRILVVEDNEINQRVISAVLASLGLQADMAETGRQALASIRSGDYGLVFMDLQLPDMDGLDVTREIRRWADEIEQPWIVATTAHSTRDARQACLAAGLNDFVGKPFRVGDIRAALERGGWRL